MVKYTKKQGEIFKNENFKNFVFREIFNFYKSHVKKKY